MKPRVCAVSYLNTTPLVWGLLHGPQRGLADLSFEVPSRCAALLRSGEVDVGLVPAIELERQALEIIPGLGIGSFGKVRSILLISKVPPEQIATLAADESSRTSVVLARILLAERFGARPSVVEAVPDVDAMLRRADACLVIGDPALLVERNLAALVQLDLGEAWTAWTGLPMVYAVWAARSGFEWGPIAEVLRGSWEYGRGSIARIAELESARRGVTAAVAEQYLTQNIHFELSGKYMEGLTLYRELARRNGLV